MFERGWQLDGYTVVPFSDQDAVSRADVIELWVNEGVIRRAEAERRADEVLLVAIDRDQRPIGVSTTYLRRCAQLHADMWYFRAFVAAAHRMSDVAVVLALMGRDLLSRWYYSGEDRRGIGVIFEVENEALKRYFPQARWMPTDFLFIGENDRGDHVRVHYFPGAPAPEPA